MTWWEGRHWRRAVRHAIRIGRLGEFHQEQRRESYVADVTWERSEELRPERLGPGAEDIDEADESTEVPIDPWRPRRSLGPMKRY
jgi:hypothetical protein